MDGRLFFVQRASEAQVAEIELSLLGCSCNYVRIATVTAK
jgi:hypothetical protein